MRQCPVQAFEISNQIGRGVRAPVLPEAAESLVPNQAGKQIIDDGRNGVVSAEAGVQAVLHVLLLVLMKSRQGSTASGSCCDRSVVYG